MFRTRISFTSAPGGALAPVTASSVTALRAYAEVAGVYVLAYGLSVAAAVQAWVRPTSAPAGSTPTLSNQLAAVVSGWSWQVVVCVPLALVLAHRRGWRLPDLGVRLAGCRTSSARRQAVTIAAALIVAMYVAGRVLTFLAPTASYPLGATGPWAMIGAFGASIRSGIVEELIVVAFAVTTLRQARRPWVEVVVVAYTLRLAYHLYYGSWWVLLWVAIWGGTAIVLYVVTRRLTALMAGHVLYDFAVLTVSELHLGANLVPAAILTGAVAITIGWIVSTRQRPSASMVAAP